MEENFEKIRDTTNATDERLEALSRHTLERFGGELKDSGETLSRDTLEQPARKALKDHKTQAILNLYSAPGSFAVTAIINNPKAYIRGSILVDV